MINWQASGIAAAWLVIVAICGLIPVAGAAERAVTKERVVIQVSDDSTKTWNQALNVIENLQQVHGTNNVEIRLVAFGFGIGILKMESVSGPRVQDAIQSGAKLIACEITMRRQKLTKEDMQPNIDYVPGGVVEILAMQKQGWSVIRP